MISWCSANGWAAIIDDSMGPNRIIRDSDALNRLKCLWAQYYFRRCVDQRQKHGRSSTIDENSGPSHGSISGSRGIYGDESSDDGYLTIRTSMCESVVYAYLFLARPL